MNSGPVVIPVVTGSLVLTRLGGLPGAMPACIAFDGYQAATLNFASLGAVTSAFDVNLKLLVQGIVFALLIGLIGGLFPAIGAARPPIAHALREL